MLEFIHNIGSRVINFFSNKFGSEGTKRPREGLDDEFPVVSPSKRFRLDMEFDSQIESRRPNFEDRYYFRVAKPSKQTSVTQGTAAVNYKTPNVLGTSRLSSGTPATSYQNTRSIQRSADSLANIATAGTGLGRGGEGFNFSSAKRDVQNSSTFQFASKPDVMKFQGSSQKSSDYSEVNGSKFYAQPLANGSLNYTQRSNGTSYTRRNSVFGQILENGGPRSGVKSIDTRKRNKLAVKECFRLDERNKYRDLLARRMISYTATPTLPAYSIERHSTSFGRPRCDASALNDTSLFGRSNVFVNTKVDESTSDSIKNRVDATSSFLSAVSSGRSLSTVSLPAWRQSFVDRRKPSNELPERTLEALLRTRNEPMKALPMNHLEKTSAANNDSFFAKTPKVSESQRFIFRNPITIGSAGFNSQANASEDAEDDVVIVTTPMPPSSIRKSKTRESPCERRSPVPAAFEKALKESQYASKDFLLQLNSKMRSDFAKQNILETETTVQYYKEQRQKSENAIISGVRNLLHISSRLPVPLEETFIEDVPEEEEVCEIIDDDEVEQLSEEDAEDEVEEILDEFPELSDDQEAIVSRALMPNPPDQVMVEGFRLQITRRDFATLSGLCWLNDEVINFYFNLIMARCENEGYPKVYAFSTFFYPKVHKEGHKAVRRWTKSIDLFGYDCVLVPVHLGNHWCLAVVDFRKKQIRYYDSMGMGNKECLQTLRNYLSEEYQTKHQTNFDWNGWQLFPVKDIPQQMNGSDCGMFACKFAEYVSRDAPITFSQRQMPYFRRRMVYEILTKKLM